MATRAITRENITKISELVSFRDRWSKALDKINFEPPEYGQVHLNMSSSSGGRLFDNFYLYDSLSTELAKRWIGLMIADIDEELKREYGL